MSDATAMESESPEAPKTASKLPLISGLILAIAGGAGGFLAVHSGVLGGGAAEVAGVDEAANQAVPPLAEAGFVELQPLVISLPRAGVRTHLRFTAQLDVAPDYVEEVESIRPRIIDVLNSYLRVVDMADLEDPAALMRLRAQMLRRVQVVAGPGRVRDVLIMEFVLN